MMDSSNDIVKRFHHTTMRPRTDNGELEIVTTALTLCEGGCGTWVTKDEKECPECAEDRMAGEEEDEAED